MQRFIDGDWVDVDVLELEDRAWSDVEAMFKEVDAGLGGADAVGPLAADSDAGGHLGIPVGGSGVGPEQVVQVAAGPERVGSGVEEGAGNSDRNTETTDIGDIGVVDEIPGLTSGDGRSGVRASRSVLQRLRQGAKKKTPTDSKAQGVQPDSDNVCVSVSQPEASRSSNRAVRRIEVSEGAAVARGPAVSDTTERRQKRRTVGGLGMGGLAKAHVGPVQDGSGPQRVVEKPAPGILSGQPKWVRDLFEAHFRGSRTRELRRAPSGPDRVVDGKVVTPNRMKMSREDFAIGWLVMLEAARRDPAILRLKVLRNGNTVVEAEGLPALSGASNT